MHLLKFVDSLVQEFILAKKHEQSAAINSAHIDIDDLLENGIFPDSKPTSLSKKALYSVCITLGIQGGDSLIEKTLKEYSVEFGAEKGKTLRRLWALASDTWKSF